MDFSKVKWIKPTEISSWEGSLFYKIRGRIGVANFDWLGTSVLFFSGSGAVFRNWVGPHRVNSESNTLFKVSF